MKQLRETSDPISKIGKQVGYKDASTFSRAFARFAGTPPRRFREQARQATAAKNA